MSQSIIGRDFTFHRCNMSQPCSVDEIANSIDTRKVRLHFFIDANTSPVVIQSLLHQLFQAAGIGATADCHQHIFAGEALLTFLRTGDHFFQIFFISNGFNLCASYDLNATSAEYSYEQAAYFIIDGRQDVGQHFNNCNL